MATEQKMNSPTNEKESLAPVALVTTVWLPNAEESGCPSVDVLNSFLLYHLTIGITKIFVFFDGTVSDQPLVDALHPRVQDCAAQGRIDFQYMNDQSENMYACCSTFSRLKDVLHSDVVARQMLNAELAMHKCAQDERIRWLLHLDVDELLYLEGFAFGASPITTLIDLVDALEVNDGENQIDQLTIVNFEAIPTTLHGGNYFTQTTKFRRHYAWIPFTSSAQDCVQFWQRRSPFQQFFLFYDNGKAMVKVAPKTSPASVHHWQRLHQLTQRMNSVSNFYDPRRNVKLWTPPRAELRACIMHYPVCGFEWLKQKYVRLGRFEDMWGGSGEKRSLRILPCFHTQARDTCWPVKHEGDDDDDDDDDDDSETSETNRSKALQRLYEAQVMFDLNKYEEEWQRQVSVGVCKEILFPSQVLSKYRLNTTEKSEQNTMVTQHQPPSTETTSIFASTVARSGQEEFTVEKAWIFSAIAKQYL